VGVIFRVAQVEAARKYQQSLDKERRVEIEEYAQYLGMHPVADEHLLWIAEMVECVCVCVCVCVYVSVYVSVSVSVSVSVCV